MSKRTPAFLVALLVAALQPLAAQAASTPHWVHYRLLNQADGLPKKVVVLPTNIKVYEVTAGDVSEEVPEWSAEVGKNVLKALSETIKSDKSLSEVGFPRLTSTSAAVVDEHIALYKLVTDTAVTTDLSHKARRFDFSIGPGLAMLQRETGADAAIMVYGRDYVSTAGRKTKAVLGNIPIVGAFTGPPPALGRSWVGIGVIDLRTGDLLWLNNETRGSTSNLRDAGDAKDIIRSIFEWYPGIEKYRKVYVK
ncbi:MAG TPA: hypothetical protein VFO43_02955 [Thiobacillus sp.]|nr:hypothetical protein [Thiobacillus sp.]